MFKSFIWSCFGRSGRAAASLGVPEGCPSNRKTAPRAVKWISDGGSESVPRRLDEPHEGLDSV